MSCVVLVDSRGGSATGGCTVDWVLGVWHGVVGDCGGMVSVMVGFDLLLSCTLVLVLFGGCWVALTRVFQVFTLADVPE